MPFLYKCLIPCLLCYMDQGISFIWPSDCTDTSVCFIDSLKGLNIRFALGSSRARWLKCKCAIFFTTHSSLFWERELRKVSPLLISTWSERQTYTVVTQALIAWAHHFLSAWAKKFAWSFTLTCDCSFVAKVQLDQPRNLKKEPKRLLDPWSVGWKGNSQFILLTRLPPLHWQCLQFVCLSLCDPVSQSRH